MLLAHAFFITLSVVSVDASEGAPAIKQYHDQTLELHLPSVAESFFIAPAATPRVVRNGINVDIGYFGGNAEQIFAGSPLALSYMSTYRTLKISGFTLWLTGIASSLAGTVVSFAAPKYWGLSTGLALGGSACGIVGSVLMYKSYHDIERAIDAYNDDLYRGLSGQTAQRHEVMFKYSAAW